MRRVRSMLDDASAPALAITLAIGALLVACGGGGFGDTYCQGGPKYGTTCYAASDARQAPGQRPRLSSEPPNWWQPAPPPALGRSGSPATTGTVVPMSSPAWRPSSIIFDAGSPTPTNRGDAAPSPDAGRD